MVTKTKRVIKKSTKTPVKAKAKPKVVKKESKVQEAQEAKVTKKAIQQTVINRELKWLYPDGCLDTLSRKAFRQKARNAITKLEKKIFKLQNSDATRSRYEPKELKREISNLQEEVIAKRLQYLADPEAEI